jgi:lipopolysaccharide/colanic/teichoic acid biosynthesis glycosyltransferase
MGITIHTGLSVLDDFSRTEVGVDEMGSFKVLTNSIRFVSDSSLFAKRALDIVCGLIGTIGTGLLALIIGPMIYIKSPGPIFFSQERVGQNGKTFRMYKFRSMYMDAEARKAALMAQNKVSDGLMFKMDDDPRIIGSEKKNKNGKPRGIGNFIRRTSLDEFPQFWNVLIGDMSLVGPRPEVERYVRLYTPEQRVVLSVKPGITDYASIAYSDENLILGMSDDPEKMYVEQIMPKKIEYNLQYINNQTMKEYFKIIFLTFAKII